MERKYKMDRGGSMRKSIGQDREADGKKKTEVVQKRTKDEKHL